MRQTRSKPGTHRIACAGKNDRNCCGRLFGGKDCRCAYCDDQIDLEANKFFGKAAQGLLDWSMATLERQQHRPSARTEPAITASLQLTDRDQKHLREEAAHRRQTLTQAVRQWPTGGGGRGER